MSGAFQHLVVFTFLATYISCPHSQIITTIVFFHIVVLFYIGLVCFLLIGNYNTKHFFHLMSRSAPLSKNTVFAFQIHANKMYFTLKDP